MTTVRIQAERPYDVLIGYGTLSLLGETLAACHVACRVMLVTEPGIYALYGGQVKASLERAGFAVVCHEIEGGESGKTMRAACDLLERLAAEGFSASDALLALGGGVVGDVAVFAASCYVSGIACVRVPTTLRAAVATPTSGQASLHLPGGRDFVSCFHPPRLVVCDCDTFDTLPREFFLDGVAECLRYGVLSDRVLFEQVAGGGVEEDSPAVVARCVTQRAAMLEDSHAFDFSDLLAYAVIGLSNGAVSSGHARAMGLAGMLRVSEMLGICVMGCAGLLMAMLDRLGLPSEAPFPPDALAHAVMTDRRIRTESLAFALPTSIGQHVHKTFPLAEFPRLFRMARGERV